MKTDPLGKYSLKNVTPRDQDGMNMEEGGEQWVRRKREAALESNFRIRATGTGKGRGPHRLLTLRVHGQKNSLTPAAYN
jgi:hypothetical protein